MVAVSVRQAKVIVVGVKGVGGWVGGSKTHCAKPYSQPQALNPQSLSPKPLKLLTFAVVLKHKPILNSIDYLM